MKDDEKARAPSLAWATVTLFLTFAAGGLFVTGLIARSVLYLGLCSVALMGAYVASGRITRP